MGRRKDQGPKRRALRKCSYQRGSAAGTRAGRLRTLPAAAGTGAGSQKGEGRMKLDITNKSTIVTKAAKTGTAKKPKAVRDEGKRPAAGGR